MNTALLAALDAQAPGPCDACPHRMRCATELLACCAYAADLVDHTQKDRKTLAMKAARWDHREPSREWWLHAELDGSGYRAPACPHCEQARKARVPSRVLWPRIHAVLREHPGEPTLEVSRRVGSSPDGARKRLLELEKVGVVRHDVVMTGKSGGAPTWRWYLVEEANSPPVTHNAPKAARVASSGELGSVA